MFLSTPSKTELPPRVREAAENAIGVVEFTVIDFKLEQREYLQIALYQRFTS